MNYFFTKAVDSTGGDYGVAVLSRFPIVKAEAYKLPVSLNSKGEIRGLAFIVVKAHNKKLGFMSVHLDHLSDDDRKLQIENLIKISKKYSHIPVILGTDLNMEPDNVNMNVLKERFNLSCVTCPRTFPETNPRITIDYIMLNKRANKRFIITDYKTIDEKYASDHLPLIAELELMK